MDIILNGLRITPIQYGGYAGAAAGTVGFLFFFMIIMFIISIGIWIFFIYGIYKILIKAGYSNDKALLYTLLFSFIPIVNIYLFYLFAYKAEWPILQQVGVLGGGKPYPKPVSTQVNRVNAAQNTAYTPPPIQNVPPASPASSPNKASGSVKCPNCGAEVKEGSLFCGKCGSEITSSKKEEQNKKCPNCGTENSPDAKFCENCGKPL
ncbi:MAG: zinc ribbon domain-containing protein [Deltaproteobacteria bacterium]|jgi:uncharacterized membrane protein YtjA (UPF0391 family)|nr:zinc ribbon domain-containing protein [Deltaproteobacteria bacterium]